MQTVLERLSLLLFRHRRPLFGIPHVPVSFGFALGYLAMSAGLLSGSLALAAYGVAFSMIVEASDILPPSRRSRSLTMWRSGLEIRSNWRALLIIGTMATAGVPSVLIVAAVGVGIAVNLGVRLMRFNRMGLGLESRVRPLGALEAGRDRLEEAIRVARTRDLSELVLQTALPLLLVTYALLDAERTPSLIAVGLVSGSTLAFVSRVVVLVRRMRPRMLLEHDRDVVAAFLETQPEVLCYYNGHAGSLYAVDVWIRVFEECGRRVGLIYRSNAVKSVNTSHLPGLVVPSDAMVEELVTPVTKVAMYPANGTKNVHLQRDPRLKHIFIGHGDSDKAGSASPFTKSYDSVWVSGTAAIDRYHRANIEIPRDRFEIVGRPQLSRRLRDAPDQDEIERFHQYLDSRAKTAGKEVRVVLYAPTWEGYFEESNYSSVLQGVELVETLLTMGEEFVVLFRPHPMTGKRSPEALEAVRVIRSMTEDRMPDTSAYKSFGLYDWFDVTDLLIADVSSVITDFMNWRRPLAVPNIRFPDEAAMKAANPSVEAAYVLPPNREKAREILLSATTDDPLRVERERSAEKFVGPAGTDPLQLFRSALDKYYSREEST